MSLLQTPVMTNNFKASNFSLTNIDGTTYSLEDCMGKHGMLIIFICNHCPYVIAIIDRLVTTCNALKEEGIKCVAIMPNDTNSYPEDSFDNMKVFSSENHLTFPYLIDKTQETAANYGAVCTPDFFGFDKNATLQYRGRLDSTSNKAADKNTVQELLNAMLNIKTNGKVTTQQVPSMGCSIKWKR